MTTESEQAAREWAEQNHARFYGFAVGSEDPDADSNDDVCGAATEGHLAGQAHGEKIGFYRAIARMESALQKISDEAKEKFPDCPDWWGVVWGMKAAIEEMKEQA